MTGTHRRKRETSTDQYAAMLHRMLASYTRRIAADPGTGLPHLHALEAAMTDAMNLGIWQANQIGGHSLNQLADVLGCSKQAVYKRVQLGKQVAAERQAAERKQQQIAVQVAVPRQLPAGHVQARLL